MPENMQELIDYLDSIEAPVPGCEHLNATCHPYEDVARRLERLMDEVGEKA